MKFFYFVAIASLFSLSALHTISDKSETGVFEQAKPVLEVSRLRLTTSLVSSQYCKEPGSDTSINLRLKLRLQYTNLGQQPLILYKYDNSISRTMVSRDPADAFNQRYLWDMSLTTVTGGKDVTIESAAPSTSFSVLAPGQFYETETETTVFVRRKINGGESDGLAPGQYLLQVIVSTWPESGDLAKRLSERWQANGLLWSKPLKSEPMAFKIHAKRKEVNCSSNN